MATVQRLNVILTVPDEEVNHYLQLGYDMIDDAGKVIQKAIPTSLGELQIFYVESVKKIAELEDIIAKLTAENVQLKQSTATRKAPATKKSSAK